MVWGAPPGPEDVPFLLTAVLMVGIAGWLMVLDAGNRLHQAFALFFFLRGVHNGLYGLTASGVGPEYAPVDVVAVVNPYVEIAVPFATLWFLHVYRRRYGTRTRSFGVPWMLLAGAVVLEALYAWDHGLYAEGDRWLMVVGGLKFASYGLVALMLAGDALRVESAARRRSLLLVSLGFALDPLYVGVIQPALTFGPAPVRAGRGLAPAPVDVAVVLLMLAGAAMVAWVALRLVRGPPEGGESRQETRRVAAFLLMPLVAALTSLAASGFGRATIGSFVAFFDGLWPLLLGLLTIAAIVRHQLFEADVKIKWGIRSGTVAAVFVAVFFVVSEGAQAYFETRTGSTLVGILAAAMLVFAISPLQRVADRVANAAMPGVKPMADMSDDERADLFREWARLAWRDGSMNLKERDMLEVARHRLGLSTDRAAALEREATQAVGERAVPA